MLIRLLGWGQSGAWRLVRPGMGGLGDGGDEVQQVLQQGTILYTVQAST